MKTSCMFALAMTASLPFAAFASEKWSQPHAPVRLHGQTYYVGTAGLSAILIRGDAGAILLDGTLAESASLVEANIRALGVGMDEIKLILNSHAHFDHAGGIASLQRASGAAVVASPSGAQGLRLGRAVDDDPQAGHAGDATWPALASVREVADGETVQVGDLAVTAHFTPGHTPGSTTWTWRSCEGAACLDVVYADSLNAISAPGFRYLGSSTHEDRSGTFRKSIRTVANLPCDILITVHPELFSLDLKLRQLKSDPATHPFIDPDACQRYAAKFAKVLQSRLASEKAASEAN